MCHNEKKIAILVISVTSSKLVFLQDEQKDHTLPLFKKDLPKILKKQCHMCQIFLPYMSHLLLSYKIPHFSPRKKWKPSTEA